MPDVEELSDDGPLVLFKGPLTLEETRSVWRKNICRPGGGLPKIAKLLVTWRGKRDFSTQKVFTNHCRLAGCLRQTGRQTDGRTDGRTGVGQWFSNCGPHIILQRGGGLCLSLLSLIYFLESNLLIINVQARLLINPS